MAILVKDGLAMRLTLIMRRNAWAAAVVAWAASAGCQRLPYIDQSKAVPRESLGNVTHEDKEVQKAQFLSSKLPMPLPKVDKPRTTNDPEAGDLADDPPGRHPDRAG